MNCFINAGRILRNISPQFYDRREYLELDKKRVKHLASTIQELLLTEMKYDGEKYGERNFGFHRAIFDVL